MSKLNTEIASIRIKELIDRQCGGSQQNFADACGVRKNSVSQWVNGITAPGNVSAVKISRVFGVDPLWIMGEDVPKYKSTVNQTIVMSEHEKEMLLKYRGLLPQYRKLIDDMIQSLSADTHQTEAVLLNGDVLS